MQNTSYRTANSVFFGVVLVSALVAIINGVRLTSTVTLLTGILLLIGVALGLKYTSTSLNIGWLAGTALALILALIGVSEKNILTLGAALYIAIIGLTVITQRKQPCRKM